MQEVWPTEDIARSFGRVLRAHRTAKLFSQERLAHEAGIDRTYVGLLERGLRQPTIATLFLLCAAMEVEPMNLIKETQDLLQQSQPPSGPMQV